MNQRLSAPLAWIGQSALDTTASFGRFGHFATGVVRALPDVQTWVRLLAVHMKNQQLPELKSAKMWTIEKIISDVDNRETVAILRKLR